MSKRKYDKNGFFEVRDNPISKVGIFPYMGSSIGADEPNRIYRVYRPEEELSDKETIESFKLIPFVDDHAMLGSGEIPAEKKGVHGTIGENVYFKDGVLYANLKIFSNSLQELIEEGKKDLSLGYRCEYDFTPGSYNGEPYDAVQRNIRGNHIALVDEGRMGRDVSVQDCADATKMIFTFDGKDLKMNEEIEKLIDEKLAPVLEALKSLKQLEIKEQEEKSETIDSEEDRREIIREIMAISAKPTEDFEGGEEEKERTIAELAEKLAYEKTGDECVEDEDEAKDEDEPKTEDEEEAKEEAKGEDSIDYKKRYNYLKSKMNGLDSAIKKSMLKEVAKKTRLADELSYHIGAFDHLEMGLSDVVRYGLQKLDLKAQKGQEEATLRGYLAGAKKVTRVGAMDSKISSTKNIIDKYFK